MEPGWRGKGIKQMYWVFLCGCIDFCLVGGYEKRNLENNTVGLRKWSPK